MQSDWFWFGVTFLFFLLLQAIFSFTASKNWIFPETSRKYLHILGGMACAVSPYFYQDKFPVILLAGLFFFLHFLASVRPAWLPFLSVNKASRGVIYFPLAFAVLSFFYWERDPVIMQASMLILGFGDAFASFLGKPGGKGSRFQDLPRGKSVNGFLVMMITGYFIILFAGFSGQLPPVTYFELFQIAGLTGLMVALAELLMTNGTDNLGIPLISALFLDYILIDPSDITRFWMVAAGLIPFVWISWKFRFLSLSGSLAVFFMGLILFGMGGWAWTVPMLVFFVLSSVLTLISHYFRRKKGELTGLSSPRNQTQVWANGGPALLVFLVAMNNLWPWSYAIFLIAVAAATADTWSTEIGQLFGRRNPVDILSFNPIEKGRSGGISIPGLLGGLAGAGLISSLIYFQTDYYFEKTAQFWILISLTGFSGTLIDSVLGSAFQVRFACRICGRESEEGSHCNEPGRIVKGYTVFNNDSVNFFSIALSVFLGIIAYNVFIRP